MAPSVTTKQSNTNALQYSHTPVLCWCMSLHGIYSVSYRSLSHSFFPPPPSPSPSHPSPLPPPTHPSPLIPPPSPLPSHPSPLPPHPSPPTPHRLGSAAANSAAFAALEESTVDVKEVFMHRYTHKLQRMQHSHTNVTASQLDTEVE